MLPADNLFQWPPWQDSAPAFDAAIPHNALIGDLIIQNYAWKRFVLSSLSGGEIPLWNPFLFAGAPFLANGQHAALYPFSVLFLIVPLMKAAGTGAILNVASTAAISPRAGLSWYNASKGWAITATKSMAVELAPKNIRVNCLCPVAGETGMLAMFMGEDTPEKRAQFRASIPLGRLSTPLDIANAALWLASDEAGFITGVALEVDGGRCI